MTKPGAILTGLLLYFLLQIAGFWRCIFPNLPINGSAAALENLLLQSLSMREYTYVYENNTCSGNITKCNTYKQLVKGESTKIACAIGECTIMFTKRSALCLLSPNQNKTIRPFTSGPKCSMCTGNYSGCENGLCVIPTPQIMMNSTSNPNSTTTQRMRTRPMTPNSTQMMMTPHKYRNSTPPTMITRPRNSSMAYTQTSVLYSTTSSVALPSLYLPLALAPLMLLPVINACF
uniref:uncharacterized protein LOC113475735 n=1 Tax=Ciona intestinalis TaxID=7719 RepID=UPI000EF46B04|nr:uncharacterized protein LOC113475735 [Ciona intestinalis]|eukprot:XP_026696214.1 uncharacterized protein LOC113475735 [Ciona intestinalis]